MTDFVAMARTNFFQVLDPGALFDRLAVFDDLQIVADGQREIHSSCHEQMQVCLIAPDGFPTFETDDSSDEDVQIDLPSIVAPFLAPGEVAVFWEIGWEGLRQLHATAAVVDDLGNHETQGFSDLADRAGRMRQARQRDIGLQKVHPVFRPFRRVFGSRVGKPPDDLCD